MSAFNYGSGGKKEEIVGTRGELTAFERKMESEGLPRIVIDSFGHYYQKLKSRETGRIYDDEIEPVASEVLKDTTQLATYIPAGMAAIKRTARITLNGGLGTSMGLTGPKSLLPVKNGQSFLEIILRQNAAINAPVLLMNSFSTHQATATALEKIRPAAMPHMFLQHKYPKILRKNLTPVTWPSNPDLEWNPPGHGDVYTALYTSGMLEALLSEDIEYAFIANCDNLGASLDEALLGYFVQHQFPFMMEVCEKTPSDIKGGHLARYRTSQRLVLRESAQCPPEEIDAFRDIRRYRFFNTNNIWINLRHLKELLKREQGIYLPLIVNPKTVDPRDANSPEIIQIETAMGAAITLFDQATAVKVPRHRFFPVKKCNDLRVVRSDYLAHGPSGRLFPNPKRPPAKQHRRPQVSLDSRYYSYIDQLEKRFPKGPPSLIDCDKLTIRGDVIFGQDVVIQGTVTIENAGTTPAVIADGRTISDDMIIS